MQRISIWKAWLDAHTHEAAERVCSRIQKELGRDMVDLSIEPYHKGGHVASWTHTHDTVDANAVVVDVIATGQRIANGWVLGGSVDDELEGIASVTGRSHISVAGISMLMWRASAIDRPGFLEESVKTSD
jgi:hypothetical protein